MLHLNPTCPSPIYFPVNSLSLSPIIYGAAADPHDTVLTAESIDAHSTQAHQNHIYGPTRLNLPDRSPLHSESIANRCQTVLHIATGTGKVSFVEEIIKMMEPDDLKLQDENGNTTFCIAAADGSTEIAKLMLEKNPDLLTLRVADNLVPLYLAALFGRLEMANFLFDGMESHLTPQDKADIFFKFQEMKFTHNRELISSPSLELVKCLEGAIEEQKADIEELIITPSNLLFDAAKSGNFELLAELIRSYPDLVHLLDKQGRSIFHIAILHRHTNIFNLIYEIGFDKELLATYEDDERNSMLHLATKYPDPPPVSGLPGATLEMQQELLIFKEVEMMMQPSLRETKNSEGQTPRELFTIEHKKILYSGEEWMKNTAKSCMVVATLIATVVFSTAFTVPGDNNEKIGIPLRLMETAFRVFAISDAIAFSSSSISIIMFLSILTSGYIEMDFQRFLPLKLMFMVFTIFTLIQSDDSNEDGPAR
ncbi:hypothetical protein Q3G72_026664 [Acer saccharum]|nr:hypothetical protein Q3G72_026664 [Acer saccharum]